MALYKCPVPYKEDRPWGSFWMLTQNEPSTVKVIEVKRGQETSLQSHERRCEFWYVLEGEFRLTIDDQVHVGLPGQEFWAKPGARHRLEGVGERNRLLEVSYGKFDENDIERFEDDYGRA